MTGTKLLVVVALLAGCTKGLDQKVREANGRVRDVEKLRDRVKNVAGGLCSDASSGDASAVAAARHFVKRAKKYRKAGELDRCRSSAWMAHVLVGDARNEQTSDDEAQLLEDVEAKAARLYLQCSEEGEPLATR